MTDLSGLRSIASDSSRVQRSQESQNQQGRQQQDNLQSEFRTRLEERLRQVDEPEEAAVVDLHDQDEEAEQTDAEEQAGAETDDDQDKTDPPSNDNPEGLGVHIDLRG